MATVDRIDAEDKKQTITDEITNEIDQRIQVLLKAQEQKLVHEANEHVETKRNLLAAKSDLEKKEKENLKQEEELINFRKTIDQQNAELFNHRKTIEQQEDEMIYLRTTVEEQRKEIQKIIISIERNRFNSTSYKLMVIGTVVTGFVWYYVRQ